MTLNGDMHSDIKHPSIVFLDELKLRAIFDKTIPMRIKGNFYKSVARLSIIDNAKTWPTKKVQNQKWK